MTGKPKKDQPQHPKSNTSQPKTTTASKVVEAKPVPKKTDEAVKAVVPEASPATPKVISKVEEAAKTSAPATALPLNVNLAFVIDDEPANRDFLERLINQAEYETVGASSGKEAIEVANKLPSAPAIIAVDSELPDIKGIELVKRFRTQFPESKIVMATMHDDLNTISEAFKHGCDVFLVKPHGFMELFKRLKSVKTDPSVLDKLVFDSHGVRQRREPKA